MTESKPPLQRLAPGRRGRARRRRTSPGRARCACAAGTSPRGPLGEGREQGGQTVFARFGKRVLQRTFARACALRVCSRHLRPPGPLGERREQGGQTVFARFDKGAMQNTFALFCPQRVSSRRFLPPSITFPGLRRWKAQFHGPGLGCTHGPSRVAIAVPPG